MRKPALWWSLVLVVCVVLAAVGSVLSPRPPVSGRQLAIEKVDIVDPRWGYAGEDEKAKYLVDGSMGTQWYPYGNVIHQDYSSSATGGWDFTVHLQPSRPQKAVLNLSGNPVGLRAYVPAASGTQCPGPTFVASEWTLVQQFDDAPSITEIDLRRRGDSTLDEPAELSCFLVQIYRFPLAPNETDIYRVGVAEIRVYA